MGHNGVPSQGLLFTIKETNLLNAILLISLINCMIFVTTIESSLLMSEFTDENDTTTIKKRFNWKKLGISLFICFIASFLSYYMIVYLFGYGNSLVI